MDGGSNQRKGLQKDSTVSTEFTPVGSDPWVQMTVGCEKIRKKTIIGF